MFISEFIKYLKFEKRYSEHTIVAYQHDLQQFYDVCGDKDSNKQQLINDHKKIRTWIVELMNQKNTPRTINRKISTLKTYYNYLLKQQIITNNPIDKIINPKTYKKLPVFFTEKNMDTLCEPKFFEDTFEGIRNKLILELFYNTGIRLSELVNLKIKDIDLKKNTLKVLGKRKKERIVYYSSNLADLIIKYQKIKEQNFKIYDNEFLILTNNGDKPYSQLIYRIVKNNLSKITTNKKRSPHILRHTFATHLLNNGADINAIKELLGHTSLSATQVYTHNTFEKLNNIYKQAHPRA